MEGGNEGSSGTPNHNCIISPIATIAESFGTRGRNRRNTQRRVIQGQTTN